MKITKQATRDHTTPLSSLSTMSEKKTDSGVKTTQRLNSRKIKIYWRPECKDAVYQWHPWSLNGCTPAFLQSEHLIRPTADPEEAYHETQQPPMTPQESLLASSGRCIQCANTAGGLLCLRSLCAQKMLFVSRAYYAPSECRWDENTETYVLVDSREEMLASQGRCVDCSNSAGGRRCLRRHCWNGLVYVKSTGGYYDPAHCKWDDVTSAFVLE